MYSHIIIKSYNSPILTSNMYILQAGNSAIVIDPFISEDFIKHIKNNSIKIDFIILTHEHYDHISGVNLLKEKSDAEVICSEECAKAIQNPVLNFSKYFNVLFEIMPKENNISSLPNIDPYSCFADITFEDQKTIDWKANKIELISTPGHSKGSMCILVNRKYLFSGDSLLCDYPTITRLKGGSRKEYNKKTLNYFRTLSPDTEVFPGHYGKFTLGERL